MIKKSLEELQAGLEVHINERKTNVVLVTENIRMYYSFFLDGSGKDYNHLPNIPLVGLPYIPRVGDVFDLESLMEDVLTDDSYKEVTRSFEIIGFVFVSMVKIRIIEGEQYIFIELAPSNDDNYPEYKDLWDYYHPKVEYHM
jgi:hypothetical protein